MRRAYAICEKELNLFLRSSSCLIFFGTFLGVIIFNFFWIEQFFSRNIMDVRPLFESMPLYLIFLSSAITMKMWTEERRSGTIELLLTSSTANFWLIIGKFFACTFVSSIAIATTIIVPLLLSFIGHLDWFVILCGYLASVLVGMSYIAFGLWASILFKRQITSLLFSLTVLASFYAVGVDSINTLLGQAGSYLAMISPLTHFTSISRGVIDIADLLYYLIFTIVFLQITFIALNKSQYRFAKLKWRQKIFAESNQIGFLIVLNLLASFAITSSLAFFRFDLTEDKYYSLSDASRNYIKKANRPILVRGYFSEVTHPLLAPLVPRIEDLLEEYKIIGDGKVIVEFFDPINFPELEREANEKYSINPTPFQFADRYQASVVNSYFNLLIKIENQYEVLSFEDLIQVKAMSEDDISVYLRNPEYDISKAIRNVIERHQSSKNIAELVDKPIMVTGYFSEDASLPNQLKDLKMRMIDFFLNKSKDDDKKYEFKIIDPGKEDESFKQELFSRYGYQPLIYDPTNPSRVWFYLSASVGDKHVDIPLSLKMIDKDIDRIVDEVLKKRLNIGQKTIGLITGSNMDSELNSLSSQFFQLRSRLEESYLISELDNSSSTVEDAVDVLLLVAPKKLSSDMIFAIDQFLMKGGGVIIFTAPFDISSEDDNLSIIPYESGLKNWLLHNGIEIKEALVLDKKNSAFPVPVDRDLGGYTIRETRLIDYPFFVDIRQDVLESSQDINQGLDQATITWASPIIISGTNTEDDSRFFLSSSNQSWISKSKSIQPDFQKYPDSGFDTQIKKEPSNMGVIVSGPFKSYFNKLPEQDRRDLEKKIASDDKKILLSSNLNPHLTIISSNNFVSDPVVNLLSSSIGSRYTKSLDLIENLIDWNLTDIDLLKIRGRNQFVETLPSLSIDSMIYVEFATYGLGLLLVFLIWFIARIFYDRKFSKNILGLSEPSKEKIGE
ncbi:MAG: Gldg family protein [Pseudomonadota bacterium]|nr:Gldg family protein [Pseudomonadota bacterium]